jgi:hypothetical protein
VGGVDSPGVVNSGYGHPFAGEAECLQRTMLRDGPVSEAGVTDLRTTRDVPTCKETHERRAMSRDTRRDKTRVDKNVSTPKLPPKEEADLLAHEARRRCNCGQRFAQEEEEGEDASLKKKRGKVKRRKKQKRRFKNGREEAI